MNVAGAPVITFRRIGTRNSGRGNSPLFSQTLRAYCGEILFFPFLFLSFLLPSFLSFFLVRHSRRTAREENSNRRKEGRGRRCLAINPFHCETFESKSKFRLLGGAAALSSGSAASASYLWTLSCLREIFENWSNWTLQLLHE